MWKISTYADDSFVGYC